MQGVVVIKKQASVSSDRRAAALAEQTSLVHWLADEGLITEEAGYDPNVSEWWAVTDKLEKAGEPVIRVGLEIWGGMKW